MLHCLCVLALLFIWIRTGLRFLSFEYNWPQPISEGSFPLFLLKECEIPPHPFFGGLGRAWDFCFPEGEEGAKTAGCSAPDPAP